jgi:hypothetical protein
MFLSQIEEFGVSEVRDLKANGRNIPVTEDNKKEYVKLICQEKMTGSIRKQIESFLEGFYEIIPKRLISIFDEQELELLISGLPTIDLDDLKANTEYHKYNENSLQVSLGLSPFYALCPPPHFPSFIIPLSPSLLHSPYLGKRKPINVILSDSMAMASVTFIRPSRSCEVPSVCHGNIQSSVARVRRT